MDKSTQSFKVHKGKRSLLIFTISGWLTLLVIVFLVVFGLVSSRLSLVIKDAKQTVVLRNQVCSDSIISRYNTTVQSDSPKEYNESFKSVATDIESLPGKEKDPNCLFILTNYYLFATNAKKARQYINDLKSLGDNGLYISRQINNPEGIKGLEDNVKWLESGGVSTGSSG